MNGEQKVDVKEYNRAILMAQIQHDVEGKTRAKLLDILELALPGDKYPLVKRNIDSIMRDMLDRIHAYDDAVAFDDKKRLQHFMHSVTDSAFVCGCGTIFTYEVTAEEKALGAIAEPADMKRASGEFKKHMNLYAK